MKTKLPSIHELSALVRHVAQQVPRIGDPDADDYREDQDSLPSIDLTIGFNPEDGSWGYQTGDNSYTGGAYGFPVWAVTSVYRRNDSRAVARDLINQIDEGTWL